MKCCTECKQSKALTEFHKDSQARNGLRSQCKECMKARNRMYYKKNREKCYALCLKYKQNNREKCCAWTKKYRQFPENRKRRNARMRERRKKDPQFKLSAYLRNRLQKALKGNSKSASTMTLLGCSFTHLQKHLEKQFLPGMSWVNHGPVWHIDHMMPLSFFDLTKPEEQRKACHYTNLQPMWAKENMSKQDKVIYNRIWNGSRWTVRI